MTWGTALQSPNFESQNCSLLVAASASQNKRRTADNYTPAILQAWLRYMDAPYCQNWASNRHIWADDRIKSGIGFFGVVHRPKQYIYHTITTPYFGDKSTKNPLELLHLKPEAA
jgi:hypothetical protein